MSPRSRTAALAAWRFCTGPFTDKPAYDLSLTKLLAIYFAIVCGHAIEEHHPVSGTHLALATIVMATAFGKATFTFFLARSQLKADAAGGTG